MGLALEMASKVRPWLLLLLLLLVLVAGAGLTLVAEAGPAPSLDDNYVKQWGKPGQLGDGGPSHLGSKLWYMHSYVLLSAWND